MSRNLRTLIPLGSVVAERELVFKRSDHAPQTIRIQIGTPVGGKPVGAIPSVLERNQHKDLDARPESIAVHRRTVAQFNGRE